MEGEGDRQMWLLSVVPQLISQQLGGGDVPRPFGAEVPPSLSPSFFHSLLPSAPLWVWVRSGEGSFGLWQWSFFMAQEGLVPHWREDMTSTSPTTDDKV